MLLNHGLLLLLLIGSAVQSLAGSKVKKNFCDGEEFRSILEGIQLPSCLAANKEDASKPARNCSIIQHFARRAQEQDQSLDTFMSRVTVLIFAHSEFMEELTVPNNPALEIASEMERHNSYIGVTKCLKSANSACQRLRIACTGGYVSKFVFLISGHCSQNFGCSLIENKEKERPTTLLNMLQYVHFRMVERQAYIAKELGELRLTTSTGTEYLIQSELDDSNGKQLTSGATLPVAVFSAGPVKNLAYYQQLAWFLEAALTLKSSFAFHIIATPLSYIEQEADRPLYRWKIREHESFLALYTRQICSSDAKWAFSCKPLMKIANEMLVPEQYSAFLLHGVLATHSLPGTSYPTFKSTAVSELSDFVHSTASYVLAVMPVDELLTDPMISLEMMDSLTSYLGSSFSITYYPVVLNKATALQILKDVDTGLNLQEVFERPCYFMRFPNGAFAVLKNDEPIATLDSTVRHIAQEGSYQIIIQSSREVFNTDVAELPEKLIKSGHISGEMARADEDTKDLVDEIRVSNQTDAFVEQLKFRDIYNVSGVLVVESDDKLMSNFFELAGKDKPWMVLFTVSWSPLCKAARSIWASVGDCARRLGFPDVQLVKIDCFEGNEICQKLGVLSYPTIAMFSRGIQLNTYSGPIVSDDLCLYTKLAFEPPVVPTSSEQETQQVLKQIISLKPRAFVYRGAELPTKLAVFAKSNRFREVFVHEKNNKDKGTLTAVHRDAKPSVSPYSGSLDDATELANYVENNHLDSVFPCTWVYLPSALKRNRPLAILFHVDNQNESADMLEHLRAKFTGRATVCHMNLRHFSHLNDLVHQLSGLNLPALVALTRPAGSSNRLIHRLPLGKVARSELSQRAADWLEKAVNNQLTDGKSVEPRQPWQPATQVFNFVDQVYHGKTYSANRERRPHSSRAFTADTESRATDDVRDAEDDEAAPATEAVDPAARMSMSAEQAFAPSGAHSAREEL